jgi:hypothetical protein
MKLAKWLDRHGAPFRIRGGWGEKRALACISTSDVNFAAAFPKTFVIVRVRADDIDPHS